LSNPHYSKQLYVNKGEEDSAISFLSRAADPGAF